MASNQRILTVETGPSTDQPAVDTERLRDGLVEFLDLYADEPLVPEAFRELVGEGDGEERLGRLLARAGHPDDAEGFLGEVSEQLSQPATGGRRRVTVGSVELPYHLLLAVLEQLQPGDDLYDVKRVAKLEQLTGDTIAPAERTAMQEVLDLYPVRLSAHVLRQMRLSPAVGYQYLPFTDELDDEGLVHTWVGQFHRGVIEQMYRNRVIFILHMSCPVYCRFCFRKHKECRTQRPPTQRHVDLGLSYIKESPGIKEVVLTGGDPFMRRSTLTRAIDGLRDIPHVQTIRAATRSIAYHPALFTARDRFWLDYLARKQLELDGKGKRLEVATHFIHPDEVSRQALEVITELTAAGVRVYVQTPLLGGCNEDGPELAELYRQLRAAGAEMHYIYIPCSPLKGNRRYRTTLADGFRAAAHLRGHLSDRAVPKLCTATAIGKIDWGTNGWAVETDEEDPRYLWLRTPYTTEFFESFAPILDLSRVARPNAEGTLDARFWVAAGDERWVRGPRELSGWARSPVDRAASPAAVPAGVLEALQRRVPAMGHGAPAIVATDHTALRRVHPTRVELELDADDDALAAALDAVAADELITDVVAWSARDAVHALHRVGRVRERLAAAPHVTALRLRSRLLVTQPAAFSEGVARRLGGWNRLEVTRPLRLEVEAVLLHPSELSPAVGAAVRGLRRHGVTVYAVVPLLPLVNDDPETLCSLTALCRRVGVELHHVVLAGHPLQDPWNPEHPVYLGDVTDLATELRRSGSGREVPRFVIATPLGEADPGLTAEVLESDGTSVRLRLLAYTSDDYLRLDAAWTPPEGVEIDPDGHPLVTVPGLVA